MIKIIDCATGKEESFVSEEEYNSLKEKLVDARNKLFPYADDTVICGMSWNSFYLIGDKASITELRRVVNTSSQTKVYQEAFAERDAAYKKEIARLKEIINSISGALKNA